MKNQILFSLKDKSKNLKCRLLQFLFGTLRVINALRAKPQDFILCRFVYVFMMASILLNVL